MNQPIAGYLDFARGRRLPRAAVTVATIIAIVLALYICISYAFFYTFRMFAAYDDEGCQLLVLAELAKGHALYDQIMSNYGPMGFLPKLALIKLLGLTVNHDTGRLLACGCWVLSSLLLGLTAWRLCGSVAWFVIGMLAITLTLHPIAHEPGHPQDLICLLLSAAMLAATFRVCFSRGWTIIVLGLIGGLLTMIKINMGAFYVAGLGTALVIHLSDSRLRRILMGPLAVLLVALPFVLMYGRLNLVWARSYAVEAALALLGCICVANIAPLHRHISPKRLLQCAIAFLVAILATCLATIALGTTWKGLADGVLLLPLRLSQLYDHRAPTDAGSVAIAVYGTALGLMTAWWARQSKVPAERKLAVLGLLRLAASILVIYWIKADTQAAILRTAPPFAWLLMLPTRARDDRPAFAFARPFLALVAVTESMWAYPVYGSQLSFSIFMLVIAAVISLADGINDLTGFIQPLRMAANIRTMVEGGAIVGALVIGWPLAQDQIATYAWHKPLALPGSQWIHLPDITKRDLEKITANLRQNADVFYTYPGRDSFYLWTGMEPPTLSNQSGWMFILDDKRQRQTVQAMESHPNACILYNQSLIDTWVDRGNRWRGPLELYIRDKFRPAFKITALDELWVRKDRTDVVEVGRDGTLHPIKLLPIKD